MKVHGVILILTMSLVTLGLRGLPFLIFGGKRQIPRVVLYLGEVLPGAALGMLVVYCLRDLTWTADGAQQLLAAGVVVLVQMWKRNTILSILAGTGLYMLSL